MVVAKRQRKGKAHENGTKGNPWTRVRTSGETNKPPSWIAQCASGMLRGEEAEPIKRGSQGGLRPLLWDLPTFTPQGCTILCQIKL